jgi:hypothetical protein
MIKMMMVGMTLMAVAGHHHVPLGVEGPAQLRQAERQGPHRFAVGHHKRPKQVVPDTGEVQQEEGDQGLDGKAAA